MRAYAEDLRSRVADRFGVSLSFVTKLLGRQRAGVGLVPKPATGRRPRCLNATAQALLVARVSQQSDVTLAELQALLAAERGQTVCLGVVWRLLDEADLRRKKKPSTPPSATRPALSFIEAVAQYEDPLGFKFVDETGLHLAFARRYRWATGGQRVGQGVPLRVVMLVTVVGALIANGLEAVMALDGALN